MTNAVVESGDGRLEQRDACLAGVDLERSVGTLPQAQSIPQNKGRFSHNLLANLASFGVSLLIGLLFTPFLIHRLGVAAYGLIPLTLTIASYLGLITLSLNSAVGRYVTIALETGDESGANRVFCTSFVGIVALALGVVAAGTVVVAHIDRLLVVPTPLIAQAKWLMASTLGMFLLTEIATPFGVASFCRNRFDLSNLVSVTSVVVRVGIVVLAFSVAGPSLVHVGMGYLAGGAVSLVGAIWVSRRLIPCLRLRTREFDWGVLRKLVGTGGWIVVNQVGALLYLSIDLLVVNRVVGADAGGRYAAVMQWSALLRGAAGAIVGVFGPTALYLHAQGNIDGLVRYSQQAVRFVGLIVALPIGLICGLSRPLLHVWLGHGFENLSPLMSLMTIHLCVNLAVLPLFSIQVATNSVKWPGLVTCVMGAANLALALILSASAGLGMYGVAIAGAVMLTAKNAIFTPIYAARILRRRWSTLYGSTIPAVIATSVVTAVAFSAGRIVMVGSWPALALVGAVISVAYGLFAFEMLLSNEERRRVTQLIRGVGMAS